MFLVQYGFRLSFYCPHGTTLIPYATTVNPVFLMRGDYEAYEAITDGQLCFDYTLLPDPSFDNEMGRGLVINAYMDILETNRRNRKKSKSKKDKYPAHNYDILVPDFSVSLRRLLKEIKKNIPNTSIFIVCLAGVINLQRHINLMKNFLRTFTKEVLVVGSSLMRSLMLMLMLVLVLLVLVIEVMTLMGHGYFLKRVLMTTEQCRNKANGTDLRLNPLV